MLGFKAYCMGSVQCWSATSLNRTGGRAVVGAGQGRRGRLDKVCTKHASSRQTTCTSPFSSATAPTPAPPTILLCITGCPIPGGSAGRRGRCDVLATAARAAATPRREEPPAPGCCCCPGRTMWAAAAALALAAFWAAAAAARFSSSRRCAAWGSQGKGRLRGLT